MMYMSGFEYRTKIDEDLLTGKWENLFLYVGHTFILSGCKFLNAPSWKEALAIGKGVAGDCKSEGSH